MTITQLLETQAETVGDKTFILCDDVAYSFRQIHEQAARVAVNLAKRGVKKDDKVVLLMGNCLEFVYVFLGAGRIGAVAVPINPLLKPDEIAYITGNSDAETLIMIPEFAPLLPKAKAILPRVKRIFILGEAIAGAESFSELLEPVDDIPPIVAASPDDAALIYTSGTTGMPKGVILTHSNYVWNARMITRAVDMAPTDRFFCVLPLFHVNAQVTSILSPLMVGADVLLMKKFNPFAILPMIEKYRATVLSAVPTIYNVMCRMAATQTFDLSSIRIFASGAAPLPEETYLETQRVLKRPLIMGYGLSEATCASAVANPRDPIKWNSVGSPLPYTGIRIVDNEGIDVPIGDVGDILVSGPAVMKGYYKNPKATEEVLKNGWLRTGDLGRIDEDGYVYIVGRSKDMIIRGGQNIYPQQIENMLMKIHGVEECCVVGIEEKRWGQEVLAVIKPSEGVTLNERDVINFCRDNLAGYKCPRFVRFVTELPKTATGKIKKNEVAAQFTSIAQE
ncbi:MAG: long-chain-fatty-acid--CoA ligase [Candidatus Hydrogenedentes bacterium]|nr:long-chain-fatty-acid--CoA ligase [Candidatus Hydrogenedentota bacterium]